MFSCNMLVLSYIHILWAISGLIGSRVFSGFFLARSVHKGGDFHRMTVYKVPVTVKKIKTFLKNALVFDMEFYFGHIIIHTYVRTSLYVCITIWEYTCTQTANLLLTLNLILWKTQCKYTNFWDGSKFLERKKACYNMV